MTRQELDKIKQRYHKGSFIRAIYTSSPALTAKAKKSGHDVIKRTETTTRFGCKYANLKGVVVKRAEDYAHSDDSILYINKKNGTEYLQFEPIENANPITTWIVDGKETTQEEASQYIIPSYFKEKEKPVVIRVKLENVEEIRV